MQSMWAERIIQVVIYLLAYFIYLRRCYFIRSFTDQKIAMIFHYGNGSCCKITVLAYFSTMVKDDCRTQTGEKKCCGHYFYTV